MKSFLFSDSSLFFTRRQIRALQENIFGETNARAVRTDEFFLFPIRKLLECNRFPISMIPKVDANAQLLKVHQIVSERRNILSFAIREPYLIVHYSGMVSTSRRKLSRCINDHYWSRSMLEFLFVAFDDVLPSY